MAATTLAVILRVPALVALLVAVILRVPSLVALLVAAPASTLVDNFALLAVSVASLVIMPAAFVAMMR